MVLKHKVAKVHHRLAEMKQLTLNCFKPDLTCHMKHRIGKNQSEKGQILPFLATIIATNYSYYLCTEL
jgi:hypothetical protein